MKQLQHPPLRPKADNDNYDSPHPASISQIKNGINNPNILKTKPSGLVAKSRPLPYQDLKNNLRESELINHTLSLLLNSQKCEQFKKARVSQALPFSYNQYNQDQTASPQRPTRCDETRRSLFDKIRNEIIGEVREKSLNSRNQSFVTRYAENRTQESRKTKKFQSSSKIEQLKTVCEDVKSLMPQEKIERKGSQNYFKRNGSQVRLEHFTPEKNTIKLRLDEFGFDPYASAINRFQNSDFKPIFSGSLQQPIMKIAEARELRNSSTEVKLAINQELVRKLSRENMLSVRLRSGERKTRNLQTCGSEDSRSNSGARYTHSTFVIR